MSLRQRVGRIAPASLIYAYEDRQITTQQALLEFEKLVREATEADVERQRIGVKTPQIHFREMRRK